MIFELQCFAMSTFKNFKQNQNINRSNGRISNKSSQLDIVNIEFSTDQIVFQYGESSDILVCSNLMITNFSNKSIYFRILSNSAQHYEITPSQDILYSSAKNNIIFTLKKAMLVINPRDSYTNTFEKLCDMTQKHLFYVQWAAISDEELRSNKIPELTSQQILKIKIVQPYQSPKNYNAYKRESYSRFQEEKLFSPREGSGFDMSKPSVSNKFVMETEPDLSESNASLLTTPIIATVAIVSFLIGFISA